VGLVRQSRWNLLVQVLTLWSIVLVQGLQQTLWRNKFAYWEGDPMSFRPIFMILAN
jgi:hypothetical protein